MYASLLKLWPEIRKHKGSIVLFMLLAAVMSALTPIVPYFGKELIDNVFKKASLSSAEAKEAQMILIALPLVYLILGVTRYFHFYLVKMVSEKIIAQLRTKLVDKILDYNLTFHMTTSKGSGGLLSKILNDTNVLQQGLNYYSDIIREPLISVGLVGYMFYTNWKLTVFCLVFTPIFAVIIRQVSKSLRKYGFRSQEAMDNLTTAIKENLDGVKIIQSFNLEDEMRRRFKDKIDHYIKQRKTIIQREEFTSPANEFLAAMLFAAICFYQVDLMSSGSATTGQFIGFIIAAGFLQKPIKKIQTAIVKIQQNVVVINRLYEIIEANSEVPQAKDPKSFPSNWQTIEYRDVDFSYGDESVLKGINLKIERGQKIALVGESGSGKSTMVNLLSRFFDPTKGEILIDGVPTTDLDLKALRKQIALVTQDVFLFNDTLENNIAFANLERDTKDIRDVCQSANALDFIESSKNGLDSMAGERGSFFSGGEKQRISIARAMFKDSDILILDEATSALDSASEAAVQKGLEELMKGKTAFVIAHRLSTVRNADRILVMKNGQIIEQGSHDSLVANKAEYFSFYQLQMSQSET